MFRLSNISLVSTRVTQKISVQTIQRQIEVASQKESIEQKADEIVNTCLLTPLLQDTM